MKKSVAMAALALTVAVGFSAPAVAGGFNVKACKACHAVDKKKTGPAWDEVAKAYGSAEALAAVFKSGFAVEDRAFIKADPSWKGKAGLMTGQFKKIKGHEDEAAQALFDVVAAGKF